MGTERPSPFAAFMLALIPGVFGTVIVLMAVRGLGWIADLPYGGTAIGIVVTVTVVSWFFIWASMISKWQKANPGQ